jgi:hypothetical protein
MGGDDAGGTICGRYNMRAVQYAGGCKTRPLGSKPDCSATLQGRAFPAGHEAKASHYVCWAGTRPATTDWHLHMET